VVAILLEIGALAASLTLQNHGMRPVYVAGGPGNLRDFVGLYTVGAPHSDYIVWVYLHDRKNPPETGLTSGTVHLAVPNVPGQYEFRFLSVTGTADKTYTLLATTPPFSV
jgi:hypothetical protein